MKRAPVAFGIGVLLLVTSTALPAQQRQLTFGGQVRPRLESRAQGEGTGETFTSMRVRVQVQALLGDAGQVFIQLQDVRYFGEETNTLEDFRADALDLHQGYLEIGLGSGMGGTLRVGRQVLALGEERLVGAVEWTQQGRSFDGARFTASPAGALRVDLFALKLQEKSSATFDFDGDFLGGYGTVDLQEGGSLDLYALLTRNSQAGGNDEHTVGGLWKAQAGPVDLRFEGSLQGGQREGAEVSAYMLGGRAGMAIHERATLTLWYDHLSGDNDPNDDEVKVFNTLFATNHAFYGAADYFLNIPLHTGGLGLRDASVKLAVNPTESTELSVDFHALSTAAGGDLSTRSLARELDLSLTRRMGSGLTAVGGYSFVQARDGIKELGRLEKNAHWAYLMLNAVFH
jgi:hypothetical protein